MEKNSKIANFFTIISCIGAILSFFVTTYFLIVNVRSSIEEARFQSFLVLMSKYEQLVPDRDGVWKAIKEKVKKNPITADEVHNKQDTLGYLLIRMNQPEPMYPVEHGLLDREIRSLNFLNELCRLAFEDERAMQILLITDAHEISYYKHRLQDILKIYENQKAKRLFPKPRYEWINKVDTKDYFG